MWGFLYEGVCASDDMQICILSMTLAMLNIHLHIIYTDCKNSQLNVYFYSWDNIYRHLFHDDICGNLAYTPTAMMLSISPSSSFFSS